MNHLTVVAKFIRIDDDLILNVDDISCVWYDHNYSRTHIRMKTSDVEHKIPIKPNELWDLLQVGSTQHLDPHDKLRETVVL